MATTTACSPDEHVWWYHASDDEKHQVTVDLIYQAAEEFGADPELMLRIARCESGLRWDAYNRSGASGLFQQMKQYWPGRASHYIGEPDASPFDPRANARVSAAMLAAPGGESHWYPSKHCWSR